jgi:transposase
MFYRWHVCSGQKRGSGIGKTKKGKGTKIMAIADASGLPVSLWAGAANTHECKLVEETVAARFVKGKPENLIGDLAYDSDPLDQQLRAQKINLIAPHKRNRKRKPTQDGRMLRRYVRRWKVERLFAWLQNYRRCGTRCDYYLENYLGFVQFACILILIKQF